MENQKPAIGRIVHYTLTEDDATQINRRRTTGSAIMSRIQNLGAIATDGAVIPNQWPIGAQAHIGNDVKAGEVYPAMIVRLWGDTPQSCFNAQVFLDGNDTFWVTSVNMSDDPKPRYCHWPTRS